MFSNDDRGSLLAALSLQAHKCQWPFLSLKHYSLWTEYLGLNRVLKLLFHLFSFSIIYLFIYLWLNLLGFTNNRCFCPSISTFRTTWALVACRGLCQAQLFSASHRVQKTPGGSLLLESVEGEREGRWPGKGGRTRATSTSSSCANTSVFSFLQGKRGHLLSPIPVLIIDDPKSVQNRGNGILFSLCQNITIKELEQIHSFLV